MGNKSLQNVVLEDLQGRLIDLQHATKFVNDMQVLSVLELNIMIHVF